MKEVKFNQEVLDDSKLEEEMELLEQRTEFGCFINFCHSDT